MSELNQCLHVLGTMIRHKDEEIAAKDQQIAAKDQRIATSEGALAAKDQQIAPLKAESEARKEMTHKYLDEKVKLDAEPSVLKGT